MGDPRRHRWIDYVLLVLKKKLPPGETEVEKEIKEMHYNKNFKVKNKI
jgi:hypothetical protein